MDTLPNLLSLIVLHTRQDNLGIPILSHDTQSINDLGFDFTPMSMTCKEV